MGMNYDGGRADAEGAAVLIRALQWYANPKNRKADDRGGKARRALSRWERIQSPHTS